MMTTKKIKKTAKKTALPKEFSLTPELERWCEQTYPQIVPRETLERFREAAEAEGWLAAKWTAKFKRVVRAGIDNGWTGIVVYRKGWVFDPKYQLLLHEARKAGFRDPEPGESVGCYRTALTLFNQNGARPTLPRDLSGVLKRLSTR